MEGSDLTMSEGMGSTRISRLSFLTASSMSTAVRCFEDDLEGFRSLLKECAVDAAADEWAAGMTVAAVLVKEASSSRRRRRDAQDRRPAIDQDRILSTVCRRHLSRRPPPATMEVPFISSGAISRAHYALVRKVETATSVPAADQVLLTEIETIRERLGRALSEVSWNTQVSLYSRSPHVLQQKQTKECLVMLLYCSMTLSPGLAVNMDFALPHAVNLAEAGKTVQNKRIGMPSLVDCSNIL